MSSFNNLTGDITNSNLELAGCIAQNNILAQVADVCELTSASWYHYVWSNSRFPLFSGTSSAVLLLYFPLGLYSRSGQYYSW